MKQKLLQIPIIIRQVVLKGPKGIHRINMILDTGSVYTTVSKEIIMDIGYNPAISKNNVSIITANGVLELPLVIVKQINIGEIKLKNIEVICHDIPELKIAQGLIGLSTLKYLKTMIDYKKKILEIK